MAGSPSLNKLVVAISSSVLQAQEQIESAQLDNLLSYFKTRKDRKGFFPITMDVNLPSTRPDAPSGALDVYHVPFLSVLPYSSLRIKKVDVDFNVTLTGLSLDDETGTGTENMPKVGVDLSGIKNTDAFTAHVTLSIESADIPEGTARLINELIKSSQVYTYANQPAEPESSEDTGENTKE